ncbi:hypothetical protein D9M72_607720 [compost metagenome]
MTDEAQEGMRLAQAPVTATLHCHRFGVDRVVCEEILVGCDHRLDMAKFEHPGDRALANVVAIAG